MGSIKHQNGQWHLELGVSVCLSDALHSPLQINLPGVIDCEQLKQMIIFDDFVHLLDCLHLGEGLLNDQFRELVEDLQVCEVHQQNSVLLLSALLNQHSSQFLLMQGIHANGLRRLSKD